MARPRCLMGYFLFMWFIMLFESGPIGYMSSTKMPIMVCLSFEMAMHGSLGEIVYWLYWRICVMSWVKNAFEASGKPYRRTPSCMMHLVTLL